MIKFILAILAFAFSITLSAQNKTTENNIKNVIETFFTGLHNGDSTLVNSTLYKDIKIQTTHTNAKGNNFLITETKETLLTNIAHKKPTTIYLEKLLSIDIKIDGNLASVWTPYEFFLNGKFSHCGANSFQLFNNNGTWQIIYLVDMRRTDNCNSLNEEN